MRARWTIRRRLFSQDQRVQVEATESYLYPDIVVVCDEPSFDTSARPASLRNPSAMVEVLSQSTIDHDLGAKLGHYRRIPSVREVLFVHVDERVVTTVTRQEDGSWKLVDTGPEGEAELSGVPLPLDAIYERTESPVFAVRASPWGVRGHHRERRPVRDRPCPRRALRAAGRPTRRAARLPGRAARRFGVIVTKERVGSPSGTARTRARR